MESLKIDALVHYLDLFRAYVLRLTLKPVLFRHLYGQVHWRLGVGMILNTALYLPLAIYKPALLLAAGPLIFGYPHLVASYRYVQKNSFHLFVIMTILAIILHMTGVGFAHIQQLPFGVWQIVVATLALIISQLVTKRLSVIEIGASVLVCTGLIRLAWLDPLIYVGGTLILHNWIAFIYWIMASKESRRRLTAIFSTLLFLIIHLLVFNGHLDSWFPIQNGEIFFDSGSKAVGWYLASWSNDPSVWYRLLILYTFGLSMHYFVWLRAIPESLNKFEHPKSFRLILKNLRQDLGMKTVIASAFLIAAGYAIWFVNFSLGTSLYFEIAILHGSLEVIFLVPRLLKTHRVTTKHL